MRRKLLFLAAAAALAGVLTALPIAASGGGAKGKQVVISERMALVAPDQQAGTFVAAGAVNDAGPGTATFTVVPGTGSFGVLRGTHVLTGSQGTITIRTTARVRPFPPPATPRAFAIGTWRIVDATGAYTDLEGGGRIVATADFTTGEITIVREGRVTKG